MYVMYKLLNKKVTQLVGLLTFICYFSESSFCDDLYDHSTSRSSYLDPNEMILGPIPTYEQAINDGLPKYYEFLKKTEVDHTFLASKKQTKKKESRASYNEIYNKIKGMIEVKFLFYKDQYYTNCIIISNKTHNYLVKKIKSYNLRFLSLFMHEIRQDCCETWYIRRKVKNRYKSNRCYIYLPKSKIIDDLTGDVIEERDRKFCIHFFGAKISINQLIKLVKVIKENYNMKKLFFNLRYSILCDTVNYIKILDILKPYQDIKKYKIDGYTKKPLEKHYFFIKSHRTDYYVNFTTIIKQAKDIKTETLKENINFLREIKDFKRRILKFLSPFWSRNLLIYIYKNYIRYDFLKSQGTKVYYDIFELNEFYKLYNFYLSSLLSNLENDIHLPDYFQIKKDENEINEKTDFIAKAENEYREWKNGIKDRQDKNIIYFEINRFQYVQYELYFLLKKTGHQIAFFNSPIFISGYYKIKSCIDKTDESPAVALKNYLKNKKSDLLFNKYTRTTDKDILLSKIEENAVRYLSIYESQKKSPHFVNDNERILEYIYSALKVFEKRSQPYFQENLYSKGFEKLKSILDSFEELKKNISDGIYKRKDYYRLEENTLYYIHPVTNERCFIDKNEHEMKKKELKYAIDNARKQAGENEHVLLLCAKYENVEYYSLS